MRKNNQYLNEIDVHFSAGSSFQPYTEFTWPGWSTPETDKSIQDDLAVHRAHQGVRRNKLLNALNPKGILPKNEPSPWQKLTEGKYYINTCDETFTDNRVKSWKIIHVNLDTITEDCLQCIISVCSGYEPYCARCCRNTPRMSDPKVLHTSI